jgi:hypothetical protein
MTSLWRSGIPLSCAYTDQPVPAREQFRFLPTATSERAYTTRSHAHWISAMPRSRKHSLRIQDHWVVRPKVGF